MNRCFIYPLIIHYIYYTSVCNSISTPCLRNDNESSETVTWHRYFHVDNRELPITIDVTDRTSHRIVSQILKILLTDRLRYANVRFNTIPWQSPTEDLRQLHSNGATTPPRSHINLEIWQPPSFSVQDYVSKGYIIDCGPLGPIARRGIFGLTETMDHIFATYNKSIDHWRAFRYSLKSWNYTVLYNWLTHHRQWKQVNRDTSRNNENVPIILIDRQEFQKPIERLFERVYSKNFFRIIMMHNETDNLKNTISDWIKYANDISHPKETSPIFFYDWYPSTVTVNRTYTRILFPDCYGSIDDPLCNFEVNQLSKMVWVKLKSHASLAYELVYQFKINQSEMANLLNKVGDKETNFEIEQLACEWLKSNKHVWTSWTTGWDKKQKLIIPALFSLYGKWVPGGLENGSLLEVKIQNEKLFKNSSYQLVLRISNLTCVEDIVLKEYLHISAMKLNSSVILAYLAVVCSDSLESILKVSTIQNRILVTSSADSPKFSNVSQYKYFFRTLPSMNLQMSLLLSTFRIWNWKRIVILRKDSLFYESIFFKSNNIDVIEDFKMDESILTFVDVFQFLKRMRDKKNARIFLVEYFAESTRIIMCAAYKLDMTLANGYVWFLNSWMNTTWNNMPTKNCTAAEIRNSTSKYFMLAHRDTTRYDVVKSDADVNPEPSSHQNFFKEFTVEGVRKIAQAINKLLKENPSAISVIDSPNMAEKFISYIANLNPNPNIPRMPDVVEGYWILHAISYPMKNPAIKWNVSSNFSFSKTNNVIFQRSDKESDWRSSESFWGESNNGKPPSDGSVTTEDVNCILEDIRKLLGVTCSSTIIILNIVILVPTITVIVSFFVYFFRRLQTTQMEEGIRKPFESLCEELGSLDLPAKDVVINRTVGRGNFGIVYGGEARQDDKWVLVAIKAISKKLDFRHKYEFLSEAKLMSYLHHENIVTLIGICLNPDNDMIYLIMEHVTGGDLKKFLIKRRVKAKENPTSEFICPVKLTKYARDIASGLLYLHQNRYLHRDVACRNCLISADYSIKVGDFGLARKMVKFSGNGYYRFSGLGAMPIRWLPPESLQFGIYSLATDIWSYGVTLYEIVTFGVFPFGGYEHEEVVDKVKRCRFTVANFLPDSFKSTKVYWIINKCCSYNANDRFKSMQEIIDVLDDYPDCVQPSLTDDPPNIQYTGSANILGPESGAFQPSRKLTSKSVKNNPELSGGHSSIPSYIFSNSDSSSRERYVQIKNDGDFMNAFRASEPNSATSPISNCEQPLHNKSSSIDYIHLTEAIPLYQAPIRTQDMESDLGYVTYKTVDLPDSLVQSSSTFVKPANDSARPNYLKMTKQSIEDHSLIERQALPNHSCSLDLSTDTGCSDADYSTDKQSPNPVADNCFLVSDVVLSFNTSIV